jgi:hypothetical protein
VIMIVGCCLRLCQLFRRHFPSFLLFRHPLPRLLPRPLPLPRSLLQTLIMWYVLTSGINPRFVFYSLADF